MNNLTVTRMIESAIAINSRKSGSISKEKANQPIGCILHIGAGNGNELDGYLKLGAKEIILVEPLLRLSKKLQQKTLEKNVKVIQAALSSKTAKSPFYELQPARFSSLNKPAKLKEVFQNLKVKQPTKVDTYSLPDLLKEQTLNRALHNVLVLQVNGSEYECLANVDKNDLSLFSNLVIQVSKDGYFKNARPSTDIVELLITKGFQLDIQSSEDAVFQNFVFSKDEVAELVLLNEKQESRLLEVSQKFEEASAEVSQLKKQKDEQSNRLKEVEVKLESSNKTNQGLLTKSEQSKLALETAEVEVKGCQSELKVANAEVSQLKKKKDEQSNRLKEVEVKLESSNKTNQGLLTKNEQSKLALETAEVKVKDCQSELELANAEVSQLKKNKDEQSNRLKVVEVKLESSSNTNQVLVAESEQSKQALESAETKVEQYQRDLEDTVTEVKQLTKAEKQLVAELSETKAKLESLGNANQALVTESEQSKLELASTENEIQKNKGELKKSATEVSRLVIVEDKLVKQVIEMTSKLNELNLINQSIIKDRTTAQVSLEEAAIAIKQSKIELSETEKQRDEQGHWHQENKKWAENLRTKLKKKEEDDKQQVLSRNLNDKLLAKALLDADDLREQFREQKEKEQELVNLIYELRNKLQTASSFYHKLQAEHPELLTLELND